MSDASLPRHERAIYAVPLVGWILKDVVHGDAANVWWLIFIVVSCWVMAIITFGYPAIILPAVAAVPLVFLVLILISAGR